MNIVKQKRLHSIVVHQDHCWRSFSRGGETGDVVKNIFSKKYTSTNYNLYLRTFWKKMYYFFIQANHLQTTSVSAPNKTPPQCWGLDHRDPRERELILWISLERDDYLGSSTSSPLVGEGGRRESSSLVLETRGRRDSSSLVLARDPGGGGREAAFMGCYIVTTNLPS